MPTSGLGSVTGVSGTQYDFTKMTNAQLLTATSALTTITGSGSALSAAPTPYKLASMTNADTKRLRIGFSAPAAIGPSGA